MKKLVLFDTPESIISYVAIDYPEIHDLIYEASKTIKPYKGSMQPYQAAILYYLAKQYPDGNVLEIGTGLGYSTFFLANACKDGLVTTITPNANEMFIAMESLPFRNLNFQQTTSQQLYDDISGVRVKEKYDMIFVDGQHKLIRDDLRFWDRLNIGACINFHDYSNTDSKSPCLPVYNALNDFIQFYDKDFDILVTDNINKFGLAGFYKDE